MRPLRRLIANAAAAKVGGPERAAAEELIWRSPGPRWFTPQDPIWWVHSDAIMFVGGIRALIVQALHPLAMAGVTNFSDFREDPWGRLQRTSHYIALTTYGPIPEAEKLLARIRKIHDSVTGFDEKGRPYRASDPRLLAWVHLAEVDAFLAAYQTFSPRKLSDAEADLYVEQMAFIAAKLGVDDPPRSVADIQAQLAAFRPELEAGAEAKRTMDFLVHEPPLPLGIKIPYTTLSSAAVAITPDWARDQLGLRGGSIAASLPALVGRGLGHSTVGLLRWAIDHPAHSESPAASSGPAPEQSARPA